MPQSKAIPDDPEEAEIYSLSVTHQLHCLVRPSSHPSPLLKDQVFGRKLIC